MKLHPQWRSQTIAIVLLLILFPSVAKGIGYNTAPVSTIFLEYLFIQIEPLIMLLIFCFVIRREVVAILAVVLILLWIPLASLIHGDPFYGFSRDVVYTSVLWALLLSPACYLFTTIVGKIPILRKLHATTSKVLVPVQYIFAGAVLFAYVVMYQLAIQMGLTVLSSGDDRVVEAAQSRMLSLIFLVVLAVLITVLYFLGRKTPPEAPAPTKHWKKILVAELVIFFVLLILGFFIRAYPMGGSDIQIDPFIINSGANYIPPSQSPIAPKF